jgi:hypothetical protein
MKKALCILFLGLSLSSRSQSVLGHWYGNANVKTASSANNYLVELVLLPEKGYIKGILNYYFRDTYRSLQIKGEYDANSRQLTFYEVPVVYHGSLSNLEVDCLMNILGTLRVTQTGSFLVGSFRSIRDYKYICPEIRFNFKLSGENSKDSVLKEFREFNEIYQVWKPSETDTLVAAEVIPRKVINYVIEREFTERKNVVVSEIEVESDSLQVDVYDNGEIDGDIISLFYNQQLIMFNQKLTHKSIKIKLKLDSLKEVNEISMFAENLGLIPPNTALMVINDGKTRHQTRVSSSLEKNAIIRIKRKNR